MSCMRAPGSDVFENKSSVGLYEHWLMDEELPEIMDDDGEHPLLEERPTPDYSTHVIQRSFITWTHTGNQNTFRSVCDYFYRLENLEESFTPESRKESRNLDNKLLTGVPQTSKFLEENFKGLYPKRFPKIKPTNYPKKPVSVVTEKHDQYNRTSQQSPSSNQYVQTNYIYQNAGKAVQHDQPQTISPQALFSKFREENRYQPIASTNNYVPQTNVNELNGINNVAAKAFTYHPTQIGNSAAMAYNPILPTQAALGTPELKAALELNITIVDKVISMPNGSAISPSTELKAVLGIEKVKVDEKDEVSAKLSAVLGVACTKSNGIGVSTSEEKVRFNNMDSDLEETLPAVDFFSDIPPCVPIIDVASDDSSYRSMSDSGAEVELEMELRQILM